MANEYGEDEILMLELMDVVDNTSEEGLLFEVFDILEKAIEPTKARLLAECRQTFENIDRIREMLRMYRSAGYQASSNEESYVQGMIIQHQLNIEYLNEQFKLLHNMSISSVPSM